MIFNIFQNTNSGKSALIIGVFIAQNSFSQTVTDSIALPIETVTISKIHSHKSGKISPQNSDFAGHDAGRFLATIPEINGIRKAGNFATDPVLRGFKYEQLNVVIDGGLNAINACPSRMDPAVSHINMNMVKEAEIFKGPYNFRFGTALGGSINFVMKEPKLTEKIKANGRLTMGYESNGNITKNEITTGLTAKHWAVDVFGSYQKGDSYKDGNGSIVPSSFLRYTAGAKGLFRWNENHTTSLQINTNQGRDVEFAALRMDLIYDKTLMMQGKHLMKWKHSLLKQFELSGYRTMVKHSMGTPDRKMVSDVESQTYGGRAEFKFQKLGSLFYSGIDAKVESAKNIKMTMPKMMPMRDGTAWQDAEIEQFGWFNEYQYAFDKGKMSLSYRMDFNQAKANEVSQLFQKLYGNTESSQLNHSISLGYSRYFGNHAILSLWAGRSQRSASVSERFINRFVVGIDAYEMLGNPHLKPETNHQADIIFTFKKDHLQFRGNGFFSHLKNYISGVINPHIPKYGMHSPGVRQYTNVRSAMKTGAEAFLEWEFLSRYKSQWAVAYTYAKDWDTHQPLPEIAPLDFRWNLYADFHPISFAAKFRYVAPQNRINKDFGELKTPDFYTVDLETQYQVFKNARLELHLLNLFNRAYAEHLNRTLSTDKNQRILAAGRNFSLGFSYIF
ncbi:TonB-dependent receptor domain-containing protein [Bergeyella zoohelcum]|uniref:TonB-dependent receptor domain-containing protein n=1 Tax=Bergeyella zoohelcum TaxID=1015 RepID=UPI002A90AE70|nr:TonB-dependent receptor [Bergeyella zoohelcum]MDY6026439.1 TonB-dependent receptor [Bergeyella zoohelcum]